MARVEMHKIEGSRQIEAIGYNEKKQTLFIGFHSGVEYKYHPVSKELYDGLIAAESKGTYFHAKIKTNSEITYSKL